MVSSSQGTNGHQRQGHSATQQSSSPEWCPRLQDTSFLMPPDQGGIKQDSQSWPPTPQGALKALGPTEFSVGSHSPVHGASNLLTPFQSIPVPLLIFPWASIHMVLHLGVPLLALPGPTQSSVGPMTPSLPDLEGAFILLSLWESNFFSWHLWK